MDMSRRNFVRMMGLVGAGIGMEGCREQVNVSPIREEKKRESVFGEFARIYQENYFPLQQQKQEVTILYPGSGSDVSPFEMGFYFLRNTPTKKVHFIYTEVGDFESNIPYFHEGVRNLAERLETKLEGLKREQPFRVVSKNYLKDSSWVQTGLSSMVLEYALAIPVGDEQKRITLSVGYNTFCNRAEPSEEEQAQFSAELLAGARKNYWPAQIEQGKIYPTYFLQEQFDCADIIISKQCGDFPLLQFDYVRALAQTRQRKNRVVLTEHADRLDAVVKSVRGYNTTVENLSGGSYGYCNERENCQVGLIAFRVK